MGVEAIAAISIVGPLRAGINDRSRPTPGSMTPVHQSGPPPRSYPPLIHTAGAEGRRFVRPSLLSAARTSGRRIQGADLTAEPGQDETAPDELRRRDHVRMGDAPGDDTVGFKGERLELGLDEHVLQAW